MEVKNIKYHNEFENGCETCDYGSQYISNISFEIDGNKIEIETEQMYEYTLTEADFMSLLSKSKSIDDFYEKMFDKIATNGYEIEQREGLEDMILKINGTDIDICQSCLWGKPMEKE